MTLTTVKKTVIQGGDLVGTDRILNTEANSWMMNEAGTSGEPAVKNIHIHNHIYLPPKELQKLLRDGIAENYSKMV